MTTVGWLVAGLVALELSTHLTRRWSVGFSGQVSVSPFTEEWVIFPLLPRFTVVDSDNGNEEYLDVTCFRAWALYGQVLCVRYAFRWQKKLWRMTKAEWRQRYGTLKRVETPDVEQAA